MKRPAAARRAARLALLAAALALGAPGRAQMTGEKTGRWSARQALGKVDFTPKPGGRVPLDLAFTDSSGRPAPLSRFFGRGPVLLQLVYFTCPGLCPMAQDGLLRAMRGTSLSAGPDFQALMISIDPKDTPKQAAYREHLFVSRYRRPGAEAGVHYLVGDRASIAALAKSVGFRYGYDAASGQFAHTTGVVTLTPDGRISHFMPGIELAPEDLRLALVEASAGKIGTAFDRVVLLCYCYDPATGRYGPTIVGILRALGVLTVLGIAGLIWLLLALERRGSRPPAARGAAP